MPHPKNLLFLKHNKPLSYLWQEVQKLSVLQHLFCDLYFSRKIRAKENKLAKHPFLLNKQIVHNTNRLQFFMTHPVNLQSCDGKTWIDLAPESLYFSTIQPVLLFIQISGFIFSKQILQSLLFLFLAVLDLQCCVRAFFCLW